MKTKKITAFLLAVASILIISIPVFAAQTGWIQEGEEWYYKNTDGSLVTDEWVKSGNDWYYIGQDGKLGKNQWIHEESGWYYADERGALLRNAMTPDGYYVGNDGKWVDKSKNEYDHVKTLFGKNNTIKGTIQSCYTVHYNDKYTGSKTGSTYVIDDVVMDDSTSCIKLLYHMESGYKRVTTKATGTITVETGGPNPAGPMNFEGEVLFTPDSNEALVFILKEHRTPREMDCYIGSPSH